MSPERSWIVATRVALWIVVALFGVLLAAGIARTFRYRPDVSFGTQPAHSALFTARRVHRLAATVFLLAMGTLAISSVGLFLVRRRRALTIVPLFAGAAAVVASFTGYLLPWDQLSLRAVTVGTDIRGYGEILSGSRVRFVLMGDRGISRSTLRSWFWIHASALPVVLVLLLIGMLFATRAQRTEAR